jgi:hypothetical protein
VLAAAAALSVALAVGLSIPSGRAAPEPGPVFTPWDGLEKGEYYDVALRADGEMCAVRDGHGRLQVCRFDEQGRIGDAIWASSGTGAAVDECRWAGEHLVYRSVEGVDDLRAWLNDPPDDILGYMRGHARICVAEPEEKRWETVASGFMATGLLGGADPPRFAVFRYDPPYGLLVEIHDGPSFELGHSYRIERQYRYERLSPRGWFKGSDTMLVLAVARGGTLATQADTWQGLVAFGADGHEHHLTNSTDNRLWSEGRQSWSRGDEVLPWGVLMPAPVNDWALVAATLAPAGDRRTRLGFFDANGLVSVLPLDAKWQLGPKELRTQGHYMMNTIAITPDGRKLVLQGLTFDRPAEGDYVWLWDYRTREAELIGRAPPVQRLFGWLRDRFLVVETGIDTAPSYGVIDTAQRAKAGVEP